MVIMLLETSIFLIVTYVLSFILIKVTRRILKRKENIKSEYEKLEKE